MRVFSKKQTVVGFFVIFLILLNKIPFQLTQAQVAAIKTR
jgi:hypothetical protein